MGYVNDAEESVAPTGDALAGKKVLVTGSVDGMTRSSAKEAVRSLGGTPSSSVSGSLDLAVLGSGPGPSKVAKINDLGITTMTGDEFLALL